MSWDNTNEFTNVFLHAQNNFFWVLDATNDFSELLEGIRGQKKIFRKKFRFSTFFTVGGQLRARAQYSFLDEYYSD